MKKTFIVEIDIDDPVEAAIIGRLVGRGRHVKPWPPERPPVIAAPDPAPAREPEPAAAAPEIAKPSHQKVHSINGLGVFPSFQKWVADGHSAFTHETMQKWFMGLVEVRDGRERRFSRHTLQALRSDLRLSGLMVCDATHCVVDPAEVADCNATRLRELVVTRRSS